jgi:hypothetical protein
MTTGDKETGTGKVCDAATDFRVHTVLPKFGHEMRKFWCFEEEYINLNIGQEAIYCY